MLAHGLAIDPSRTLRCPATSKVSTAPLGHVTSLSFNRRCKEKNKVFINVDRFGFLHFVWLLPFFQTFPLVPAVMNTNFQPNVSMQIYQIQYSFLLCTEKCQNRTSGNCIVWGHGWFFDSWVFANHVYDKKILHNQFIHWDGHGRTQGPATLGTSPGSGVMTARGMLNLREASYSKWLPRRLRKRWIS